MSTSLTEPVDRLATLLAHAERGALAIALYDRLSVRHRIIADLRQRSSKPVREVHLSEEERNRHARPIHERERVLHNVLRRRW